ncbi:Hypothetical predicted protein [Olea europaea subsp. europaea]|uniref:Uncharacterized protein n=1 Tax=Olea europaea subsp. europaea TaxID=158383 RepID=A0A8S0R5S7_OLEEU|nr:Hypothetical predicted protein [Olea europaea subsp. europaea]
MWPDKGLQRGIGGVRDGEAFSMVLAKIDSLAGKVKGLSTSTSSSHCVHIWYNLHLSVIFVGQIIQAQVALDRKWLGIYRASGICAKLSKSRVQSLLSNSLPRLAKLFELLLWKQSKCAQPEATREKRRLGRGHC